MIAPRRLAPLALLLIGLAGLCLSVALMVQAQSQEVTPTAGATGENPPAKPTNLQASAEHDAVALTWTASTDQTVTHYAVLRRNRDTDATGVFHVIEDNAGPETSYTDNSVAASSRYNYRVKAVSPTGVSQWSGYVKANTPAAPDPNPTPTPTSLPTPEPESSAADQAPTGLTVALAEGGGVDLSWSAPAEDADSVTGYEVLRAAGDAEFSTLDADTASTTTSYTDATATDAGETYAYHVKAIRGADRSQASGQAEVQIPHDAVDLAPSDLTAKAVDGGGVDLSWSAPAEDADSVTGYEVLRAAGDAEFSTLDADTASTTTSYTDATATQKGETYAYQVKAIRGADRSQASGQAEIQVPHDSVDLAPTNLAAASVDDGINLTWNAPAAESNTVTGYQVLRQRPNQNENALTVLETNTASTATTYQDTGATAAGQTYVYAVRALRDDETSQSSDVVEIKRPETAARAPSNLTGLTSLTIELGQEDPDISVILNWTAPAEDGGSVTGYEIQRAQGEADFATLVAETSTPGTEYTDASPATAEEAGNYRYRVIALRPEGKSLPSNQWPDVEEPVYLPFTINPELGNTVLFLDQDVTTSLVKNTAQTAASTTLSLGSGEVRAQSFTTGANTSGYTLSSIGVSLNSATSTAATDLTAKVQENSAGEPGSDVCTLTGSAAYAVGVNAFDAPANCNLSANTTYFFVLTYSTGTFTLDNTSSGDEDTGSNTNWSIGDDSLNYDSGTSSWNTVTNSLLIDVQGTAVTGVLISNTGQLNNTTLNLTSSITKRAQAFTTGTNTQGYALSSISFKFDALDSPADADDNLTVTLNSDSSGDPGSALCTLDDPSSFTANAVNTFSAPTTGTNLCPSLAANTTYFAVIEQAGATDNIRLTGTIINNEDAGGAAGWSIANERHFVSSGSWSDTTANLQQIQVSGTFVESTPPGITVSETELTVTEGDTTGQTYTVVLHSAPTANVTVTIGGHSGTDVSVSPATLSFTAMNWNTAQNVTVKGLVDADAVDDASVTLTHTASGATEYSGVTGGEVEVTITEKDMAEVTVDPTALTVEEGTPKTYSVKLDSEPSKDVVVDIEVDGDGVTAGSSSLTFTAMNWNLTQDVRVTVADDDDAVDDPAVTIDHAIAMGSADEYLGVTVASVDVTPTDDDEAGVEIDPTEMTLLEGASGSYAVKLTSEPTVDNVTITVAGHSGTDVSLGGSDLNADNELTFTADNWNTAQTVSVSVGQDADVMSDAAVILTHAVSSTGDYSSVTAGGVTVNITDDDSEVSITAAASSVAEGQPAAFTLTRTGYQGNALTVNVAVTEDGGWGYIQGTAPTTVEFAANSGTTTLNVNTDDDLVVGNSGSIEAELSASSPLPADGAGYLVGTPDSATVNITDNDVASDVAWSISPSPSTLSEGNFTTVELSITSGHTFAEEQTLRLRWHGAFVSTYSPVSSSPRLELFELPGYPGVVTAKDGMKLAAGDMSVSAQLGYYVDASRNLYPTGTVGEATASLEARLDADDVAMVDLTLRDDEGVPQISVSAPNSVPEGDNIVLSASISPRADYTVTLTLAHTDPDGALTGTVPTQVQFSARSSSASAALSTLEDVIDTDPPDDETVTLTVSAPASADLQSGVVAATLTGTTTRTVLVRDDDRRPGSPVGLAATAGNTVVDLTWTAGDGGTSTVTGYEYRQRTSTDSTWNPDWTAISGSSSSTVSHQVTGLRNDTAYRFEVRAVSAAGKGYSSSVSVGSYSTLVYDEDKAPSYFLLFLRSGAADLSWRTPRRWVNDPVDEHPTLSEYEIQQRVRYSDEEWGDWAPIEGIDSGFLSIDDSRLIDRDRFLRDNQITEETVPGVSGPPVCWQKQWRIRAIYEDPPEHSTWDHAGWNRTKEPRAPFTPPLVRLHQSFIKTGDNAYSLTFKWGNSAHLCWPNTAHEVQRRQFVGMWFGANPPRDGDTLDNGATFNANTMTAVYNRVWTNWQDVASLGPSVRQYTHAFTGAQNYQVRVRAQNKYGWGEWTRPWLFSINLRLLSDYSTRVEYP